VLAVVTAVYNAKAGSSGSPQSVIDGFHAAILVSLIAGVLGAVAMALPTRRTGAELAVEGA
jgi:hypothetical protein